MLDHGSGEGDNDPLPMPRLLALGITIGLITGFVQSLGLTLQRKAHVQEGNTKTMWRIGFTIFILANLLGSTVQIAALPLTILAPLHACGLVYNAILATLMLGEPFTWLAWVGTVLVAIGASLIGVFGAITEPSHTLDQLLVLFAAPRFLGWMSFQLVLALGIIVSVSIASRTEGGKSPRSRLVQGAALGCLAGIMASHCLLLAKLTVELLVTTFGEGVNQFNRPQAWFILFGLVFGALAQLYYLNRGLRMCTTTILYPLNFGIYNITTILDGLIYYKQGTQLTPLQIGLVVLGVVLLLLGVAGLSWRFRGKDDNTDDPGLQIAIPGVYDVNPESPWLPKSPSTGRRRSASSASNVSRDFMPWPWRGTNAEDTTEDTQAAYGTRSTSDLRQDADDEAARLWDPPKRSRSLGAEVDESTRLLPARRIEARKKPDETQAPGQTAGSPLKQSLQRLFKKVTFAQDTAGREGASS